MKFEFKFELSGQKDVCKSKIVAPIKVYNDMRIVCKHNQLIGSLCYDNFIDYSSSVRTYCILAEK